MNNEVLINTAKLARVDIAENQEKFLKELESILDYVEIVNNAHGNLDKDVNISENQNVFKEDVVESSLSSKDVLKNAPKVSNDYIEIEGIF
ncbi:MAG: Asp-tRNA(Asn)/Glu-tRNA(Gln) amidotransferase subunit GatC [bacterium]|jgi:aspartyl-tRNA(Asn)/glutamyl-tRNA(Gln) amidotransferase subunit C|nr:Asp-tRNA(Asn)/Glu-tRNA(Gln) amidotransferase subunit GatC [bacterium]